jgi:hypothetical protein
MSRFIKFLLVLSLIANGVLVWVQQSATADAEAARLDAERYRDQVAQLNRELRTARAGDSAMRADAGTADTPLVENSASTAVPDSVIEALRTIQDQVATLRGITPDREVPIEFLDRDQLRAYFQQSFDRDYSPEEREQDRKLLSYLGLIPADFDLPAFMVDLLQEQVVGFYDDDRKRMALIGESSALSADEKITYAHEFTHALQDQRFNLKQLNPPDSDNDDRGLAGSALVEGDATVLMGMWASQYMTRRELQEAGGSGGEDDKLKQAPLVLRTELLFPYSDGQRFVQRLYDQGGTQAVDQAFRNPPRSTEQILHPDRYAQGDEPVDVTLPPADQLFGAGWSDLTGNTLGELDLRILVQQYTDSTTGNRAASGWGGDRYRLVERADGQLGLALKTTWDTSNDANEFFDGLTKSLRKRFNLAADHTADASNRVVLGGSQPAIIARSGSDVILVMGPDDQSVTTAAAALGY